MGRPKKNTRARLPTTSTSIAKKIPIFSVASIPSVEHLRDSWVKGRGLVLAILWRKGGFVPVDLPQHDEIWSSQVTVNLWEITQCEWMPKSVSQGDWLTPIQLIEGNDKLRAYLNSLVQFSNNSVQEPAYTILYLEELQVRVPPTVVKNLHRRSENKQSTVQKSFSGAVEEFLDVLQHHLGIDDIALEHGWSPSRFTHYDREKHQQGWIIISPSEAVVVRLPAQHVYTLASLLQPRDIDDESKKSKRIHSQRYEFFHERVMQWNATNDIFEAVAQLEEIVDDSKKSTDGQLWLNFALAAIGVLLSLFSLSSLRLPQTGALVSLSLASIFHALYARQGNFIYQVLGWIFFALAILLAVSLLLF